MTSIPTNAADAGGQATPATVKPGTQTTEFLLTIAAIAMAIIPGVIGWLQSKSWGGIVLSVTGLLVVAAYVILRTMLKLEAEKRTNYLSVSAEEHIKTVTDLLAGIAGILKLIPAPAVGDVTKPGVITLGAVKDALASVATEFAADAPVDDRPANGTSSPQAAP